MTPPSSLGDLLVLFALSVVVLVVLHRLRIPSIVGFLLTGILSGPYGFGLIRNIAEVHSLAEVGVILLLFTVGLEFSLQQLGRIRTFLLVGGGLQVGLTLGFGALAARALGLPWPVATFAGMLVALSSTAIVLRLLAERAELDTPHGRAALGILIFQDLCIVPMMLITPMLAGRGTAPLDIGLGLVKAALFVAAALLAARYVVPALLHVVAGTRRREVFLLTIILLCLGTAWASAAVGLSLALGAFIAGLVIADSEYSHQALGEVLPLREVFNSLFFISIGMLFDVRVVLASPLLVFGIIAVVLLLKALVTGGVSLVMGQSLRVAVLTGLSLAQIGEFSFVLSTVGTEAGVLGSHLDQVFLAVAVGTMAITPALIAVAPRAADAAERLLGPRWRWPARITDHGLRSGDELAEHVIIAGYGFNGRNLARVLKDVGIPYVVVDMNPRTVRAERRAGERIVYGDITSPDILAHAGIARARIMVIAISDIVATRTAIDAARRLNPGIHIIARAKYVQEARSLLALGTAEVIPEEFETAIEIFTRVLRRYLVPRDVIEHAIHEVRREHLEMFRPLDDAATRVEEIGRFLTDVTLAAVRVDTDSSAAGATLSEAGLRERTGATVVAIQRRGGGLIAIPSATDVLGGGDTVLLLGRPDQLALAQAMLRAEAAV